jgi:hypothetical protein
MIWDVDVEGVVWEDGQAKPASSNSDSDWGLRLGEAVALSILSDQSNNYAGEDFEAFTITKFDGTTVKVSS